MTIEELRAAVAERYAAGGAPSWDDPHPDREPPESAYSRVTDAARYRVVHERARAWAQVLAEHLDAGVTEQDGDPTDRADPTSPARTLRVAVQRPGTLPLLLVERGSPQDGGDPLPVLAVAVGEPATEVVVVPDCGCDACDSGSADLLEAVDDAIAQVVSGPFVALRGRGWHAEWHPDAQSSGHEAGAAVTDHALMTAWCEALVHVGDASLPPGTTAYVGRSWLA